MPDATDEFVTVFASRSHSAEIEAEAVHGLLESSGIESLIVRENVLEMPVGRVSVKVFSSYQEEAKELIEAARLSQDSDSEDDESEGHDYEDDDSEDHDYEDHDYEDDDYEDDDYEDDDYEDDGDEKA